MKNESRFVIANLRAGCANSVYAMGAKVEVNGSILQEDFHGEGVLMTQPGKRQVGMYADQGLLPAASYSDDVGYFSF